MIRRGVTRYQRSASIASSHFPDLIEAKRGRDVAKKLVRSCAVAFSEGDDFLQSPLFFLLAAGDFLIGGLGRGTGIGTGRTARLSLLELIHLRRRRECLVACALTVRWVGLELVRIGCCILSGRVRTGSRRRFQFVGVSDRAGLTKCRTGGRRRVRAWS